METKPRSTNGSAGNAIAPDPAGNALLFRDQANNGKFFEMKTSTVGFRGITLSLLLPCLLAVPALGLRLRRRTSR